MRESEWQEQLREKRWRGAKRYLRHCRRFCTETNARNYVRWRYGLSFSKIGELVREVDREDRETDETDNQEKN